jgi:hypothetical protein
MACSSARNYKVVLLGTMLAQQMHICYRSSVLIGNGQNQGTEQASHVI